MPGTLLSDDLQDEINRQLQDHVSGIIQFGQQAFNQAKQSVQDELNRHIEQATAPAQQVAQDVQQGVVNFGQQQQQNLSDVQNQLHGYVDQVTSQPVQFGPQPPPPQTPAEPLGAPPQPSSLPHNEEPATATDQVARGAVGGAVGGPDLGANWKTQFDFGQTYTGDYRTGTPHRGVDLVPSSGKGIGTEVDAFEPGTVTLVQRDSGAGGLMVYVKDADGLTHAYMHLNDAIVKPGDVVVRGTPIAHMGESGTEGSPHLHYEVRANAAVGDPLNQLIDPRPYVSGAKQPGGAPATATQQAAPPVLGGVQQAVNRIGQGKDDFINSLAPLAAQYGQSTGIDPALFLSIAGHETGWGQSSNAQKLNNLFSIQGSNAGGRWAGYDSPGAAFQAFVDLVSSAPRYAQAWADRHNPLQFVNDLRNAGYVVDEPGFPAQTWVDRVSSIYGDIKGQVSNAIQNAPPVLGQQAQQNAVVNADQNAPTARPPMTFQTNQPTELGGQQQQRTPFQIVQDVANTVAQRADSTKQDVLNAVQQTVQALEPLNQPPLAQGQPAQQAIGGAFSGLGTAAQNVVQALGTEPPSVTAARQQAQTQEGRRQQLAELGGTTPEAVSQDVLGLGTGLLAGAAGERVTTQEAPAIVGNQAADAVISGAKAQGWQPSPDEERIAHEVVAQVANPMNILLSIAGGGEGLTARGIAEGAVALAASIAGGVGAGEAAKASGLPPEVADGLSQAAALAAPVLLHTGVALGGDVLRAPAVQEALRSRQPAQAEVNAALGGIPEAVARARGEPAAEVGPVVERPPIGGVQRLPQYTAGTPEAGFEALARQSRESSPDGLAHIDLNTVPKTILPFDPAGGRGIVKTNPGGLPTMDDLRDLYDLNAHKRDFYVDQGDSAAPLVGPHNAEEYFTLNSINSQQTGTTAQVAESIRTMGLVRQIARDSRAAGDSPEVTRDKILTALGDKSQMRLSGPALNNKYAAIANGYSTGEAPVTTGAKTSVFAGNYGSAEGRFFDPRVTNDIHNWRIMNVDSTQVPRQRLNKKTGQMETFMDTPAESAVAGNDTAYRGVEAVINELARERGVDGYAMQSALWDGLRAMQERNGGAAWKLWQQGDFQGALRNARDNGVFTLPTAGNGVTNVGEIARIMNTPSVKAEIAKYGPILKDPLPPELNIPTVSRTFAGKGPAATRRPSNLAVREEARVGAEAGAPQVGGLDDATVERLGLDRERGIFPWLAASHRVVEIAPDEYAVHLPAGNVDTARYVAGVVGSATGADAVRIHVPDYRSGDTIGVRFQGSADDITRLSDALDNIGQSHIVGTGRQSLQVPYERTNDARTRNSVIDAAQSVGVDPNRLEEYTGSVQDVRKAEYATAQSQGAASFAPSTAERSALLQRGLGVGAEGEAGAPSAADVLRARAGAQAYSPFAINLAGGALGGAAGNVATPEGASLEERLRNIGLGALTGLAATHGITRLPLRPAEIAPGRESVGFRAPNAAEDLALRATTQEPPRGGLPRANRYALREPRAGEVPMSPDEMVNYGGELEQRYQQVQDRLNGIDELIRNPGQKIDRPRWAVGLTNDQVAAIAHSVGESPFSEGWYERAGLEQGSGEVRDILRESGLAERGSQLTRREMTPAQLRAERARLQTELGDIQGAYEQMTNAPADARFVRDIPEAAPTAERPGGAELPFDTGAPREEPASVRDAQGSRDEGARLAQEIVLGKNRGTISEGNGEISATRRGVTGTAILDGDAIRRATEPSPTQRTLENMPNLDAMLKDMESSDMAPIAAQIRRAVEDNPDLFEAYRQGRISFDSVKTDLATRVGMSKEDWLKTDIGKGFNQNEMAALQAAAVEAQGRLQDMGQEIMTRGGVNALSDAQLAHAAAELTDASRLLAVARGGRATAGRTLNILKQRFDRGLAAGITASNERIAASNLAKQARAAARKATAVLQKGRTLETEATAAKASASRQGAPRDILAQIDQAYAELDKYNAMTLHEKASVQDALRAKRAELEANRKARVRSAPEELLSALRAELKWEQTNFAKRRDNWETQAFWDSKAFENAMAKRTAFRGQLYIEQQRKLANIAAKSAEKDASRAFDQELQRRSNQQARAERLLETVGGREVTREYLNQFLQALNDPDPMVAAKFIKGTVKPSNWVRANVIRIAGLVSAPITHMVNLGGNTATAMVEHLAVRPTVVLIDAIRSGITGGERQAYRAELLPAMQAYGPGFFGKIPDAVKIMQTGINPQKAIDLAHIRPGFASGSAAVDLAVEAPLRALEAEDALFRGGATSYHGMRVGMRQAIREGFSGNAAKGRAATIVANLEDYPELAKEVADAAARDVFQERRTFPGLSKIPETNEAAQLAVSQVLPFVRTPANITAQGVAMSPLGVGGIAEAVRGIGREGQTSAQRGRQVLLAEERLARTLIGTGILGGGLALGAAKMLTASYPTDPQEASTLPQGWRPWSLRIGDPVTGNVEYIPLQNLGPMGFPLAMAAIVTDPVHHGKSIMDADQQVGAAASIGKYVIDNTFLQGLSDFVDLLQDPRTNASKFLEPEASSFMPYSSAARELQRVFGVASRNPHEGIQGVVEAMEAVYPGLAGNVPPSLTPIGEERTQGATGLGRLVPLRYDIERDEPTLRTLRENGVGIPAVPRAINAAGGSVPLQEDERAVIQRQRGPIIRQTIQAVTTSPRWATLDQASKSVVLQTAISNAARAADGQYLQQLGNAEIQRRWTSKPIPEPYYVGAGATP